MDCCVVACGPHAEDPECAIIPDHHLGLQTFHQRVRDAEGDGCHQIHPAAAEFRLGDRQGQNDAAQTPNPGIPQHHLPVAQDVLATDLEYARRIRVIQGLHQIFQH